MTDTPYGIDMWLGNVFIAMGMATPYLRSAAFDSRKAEWIPVQTLIFLTAAVAIIKPVWAVLTGMNTWICFRRCIAKQCAGKSHVHPRPHLYSRFPICYPYAVLAAFIADYGGSLSRRCLAFGLNGISTIVLHCRYYIAINTHFIPPFSIIGDFDSA